MSDSVATRGASATTDTFQWLNNLLHTANVFPDPATLKKLGGSQGMFTGGKAAMIVIGYWQIAAMAKGSKGISWKTVPMPAGPKGRISGFAANDNFSIFSTSKQVDAAWEYTLYWMRNDVMIKLPEIGLNPASKPAVNADPSLQKLPYADALKIFTDQLQSNQYDSVPTPANQLQGDVLTAGNTAVAALWAGKTDLNSVLETLDQQLKAILAKPLPTG